MVKGEWTDFSEISVKAEGGGAGGTVAKRW